MPLELKLKALKVADLKAVLAKASEQPPAKATKADLIARILASQPAQDAYKELHEPDAVEEAPAVEEAAPEPEAEAEPAAEIPPVEAPAAPVDTELERRKARAARFGIPFVEQPTVPAPKPKKAAASGKKLGAKEPEDPEKLEVRAARFGTGGESKKRAAPAETVDAEEAERRRKRAERFGL